MSNQLSIYELLIKNPFERFKEKEWFKDIMARINYESNSSVPFEESGFPFWPKKD